MPEWIARLADYGPTGFLAAVMMGVLWYLLTRTVPGLLAAWRQELQAERQARAEAETRDRQLFAQLLREDRALCLRRHVELVREMRQLQSRIGRLLGRDQDQPRTQ
ncbi:MAG: hypothetical protein C4297_11135 [Gemmataceae bacterium]